MILNNDLILNSTITFERGKYGGKNDIGDDKILELATIGLRFMTNLLMARTKDEDLEILF